MKRFRAFLCVQKAKIGGALLLCALTCIELGISLEPTRAATRVEKTFGSWLVTCVDNGKKKNCTLGTRAVTKENKIAFIWNISLVDKQLKSRFLVPTGVSLLEGVRFSVGNANPITAAYNVCGRRICIADFPIDQALIGKIRGSKSAKADFVTGNKKTVQVELDLTEFPKAYDYFYTQSPR
jgi:invasion protein IalB